MTRKHFELIAEAIKDFDFVNESQRLEFATHIASTVCKPQNSRFNADRFLKACGASVLKAEKEENEKTDFEKMGQELIDAVRSL